MSEQESIQAPANPPILEYATAGLQPRWQQTIRVLLWIDIAAAVVSTIACIIDVETIVVAGPALFLIGLLLLIFGQRTHRWLVVAGGIELMFVVVTVFALINLRHWSPSDAQLPVSGIAVLQTVCATVLAARALWRLHTESA